MVNNQELMLTFEWNTPVKFQGKIIASINELAVTIILGWKRAYFKYFTMNRGVTYSRTAKSLTIPRMRILLYNHWWRANCDKSNCTCLHVRRLEPSNLCLHTSNTISSTSWLHWRCNWRYLGYEALDILSRKMFNSVLLVISAIFWSLR